MEPKQFEKINYGFNKVFQPNELSLGLFFAIESYKGSIPTMKNQLMLAQLAENAGFTALWVRDVPFLDYSFGDAGQIFDPWVYLTHIAANTKDIALGTGSIILPLRHPVHIAKSSASIDVLSGGRLIMGVASGDRPLEYPAFNKEINQRAELFRESLTFLKRLYKPFPVIQTSMGKTNGSIDILPKPTNKRIPILITGHSGGQSLDWIAENGDGWLYYPRHINQQKAILNSWNQTLEKLNLIDKPFAQSFYLDLSDKPDDKPIPIHLGYRIGRYHLLELFANLKKLGVNHIIINLKYGTRPPEDVLEEIGEYIIPEINKND